MVLPVTGRGEPATIGRGDRSRCCCVCTCACGACACACVCCCEGSGGRGDRSRPDCCCDGRGGLGDASRGVALAGVDLMTTASNPSNRSSKSAEGVTVRTE